MYKSKNLSPKSPIVWNYEPVKVPRDNDTNKDEDVHENEEMFSEQQEQADDILQKAREQAEQEAQEILENAKKERDNIIEKAQKEGYEQGYQEGYEAGKEQAMEDTKSEREKLLAEAQHVLEASKSDYQRLLDNAEPEISHLIVDIAEKLISDKLTQENELITELVKNGLQKLKNQDKVVIRAHPEDYSQLEEHRNQLVTEFEEIRLELVRDEELTPGAPLIFGDNGHIELNVKRQLDELRRSLKQVVNHGN